MAWDTAAESVDIDHADTASLIKALAGAVEAQADCLLSSTISASLVAEIVAASVLQNDPMCHEVAGYGLLVLERRGLFEKWHAEGRDRLMRTEQGQEWSGMRFFFFFFFDARVHHLPTTYIIDYISSPPLTHTDLSTCSRSRRVYAGPIALAHSHSRLSLRHTG